MLITRSSVFMPFLTELTLFLLFLFPDPVCKVHNHKIKVKEGKSALYMYI